MEIDHIVIATTELDAGSQWLSRTYGLVAVEGGAHPAWGTANRIVPLGDCYLEVVAVVDYQAAAAAPFGRWIQRLASDPGRLAGWAVRVDDIDAIGARLGLVPEEGSRVTREGRTLRWRLAGVSQAMLEPMLPFFIQWESGSSHPGHGAGDPRPIVELVLHGVASRVSAWLGDHGLPIRVEPGPSSLASVVLGGPLAPIVLKAARTRYSE